MKIRDRVRFRWALLKMRLHGAVVAWLGVDRVLAQGQLLQSQITALRDAEERHYRDLQHGEQEMEQKLDEALKELDEFERNMVYRLDLIGAQLVVVIQMQTAQGAPAGRIEEGVNHLINLVEPKAGRLRAGSPVVLDWDEVQRQNAAQELENNDGQPVRR